MTPTPAQRRAMELFVLASRLPARSHLDKYVLASAVGQLLQAEGFRIEKGCMRHLDIGKNDKDKEIVSVEVLQVDGAWVDATGIHQDWEQVAIANGASSDRWVHTMSEFAPQDPNWLGRRLAPQLARAIDALRANANLQILDRGTPQTSAARPGSRL